MPSGPFQGCRTKKGSGKEGEGDAERGQRGGWGLRWRGRKERDQGGGRRAKQADEGNTETEDSRAAALN